MMASPSELTLDCKPHSYSMLLKSVGEQSTDQTQKLEEFLARLEEERLKIDAFKRELPLCMQLLTNAMEASRQQLHSYRVVNHHHNQGPKPVLEEFIPLKHPMSSEGSEKATTNASDKANWMTSAQLWSDQAGEEETKQLQSPAVTSPKESSGIMGFGVNLKQAFENKQRNGGGGGAFLPFSKDRNSCGGLGGGNQALRALPELALSSSSPSDKETEDNKKNLESSCRNNSNGTHAVMEQQTKGAADSHTNTTTNNNTTTTSQTHRKARRCWSPDLHRRFVNALQMLGGSQVATPKQIRELMKVDGLTNDEVKSHLQKYRLHTRRPSPSPQAAAAAAPQLVVLGGIWVQPEYATAAAAHHGGAPATLYGAHHASSPHYCATPVPQEFYPAPTGVAPPVPPQAAAHHHQLLHHPLHNQLHHVYHPASQTTVQSSPESDIRGTAGDRSESIEDGKSESSSWKADDSNGENGGERKRLTLRGEDGEESNGSEITLKF